MFKSTRLTKNQIKHEEETKSPAKFKDFINHELRKNLNSKKSIRKTISMYTKDWMDQNMKLKCLNINTAQNIITLLSHIHNIWNNKEIAPRDEIVKIGYVISGALFELAKEQNTKKSCSKWKFQILINEQKINTLDLEQKFDIMEDKIIKKSASNLIQAECNLQQREDNNSIL